ncbi:phytanoyl-CoA dioxygenase family protein [Sphingomonas sp.]|uniref:phytanoyl-CoA dioxygenase family protein n=1 Tax=Sphingomonas sp. TaxID=28214 RepID=UPI002C903DA7|nr:phytanoyl-CoA dioxygenase family protein [Sphingomonas sp.]HWK35919.1 phytanoyl-CoA dioxygenase family protein [Sphingomonas sp.]
MSELRTITRAEVREHTNPMFVLRRELETRVDGLGLKDNVRDIEANGFTVVKDVATPEFTARLRETILRLKEDGDGPAWTGGAAGMLLDRDPIFVEVVTNPKLRALVEVMCGQGAILMQLLASVRPKGTPALPLHADQNWLPAPFPEHNQIFTMCWVMDPFTREGGATSIIPGSHRKRRHPTNAERDAMEGAVAIEADANSLACWDGSVWHGNYPRALEGERVVLHITFGRLALRPVENYDYLGEDWLADKPEALRIMLGREDFLGKSSDSGFNFALTPRTFDWAKN